MKLDCVLTAVNENPLYLEFIPIFIKTWEKLYPNIDVKIILIANSIPDEYTEYTNNIILFQPIDGILTAFTAQCIRLLYPCLLNYENGVMITDMDMLPMNRSYYTKPIEPFDNKKFIYMRENILMKIKKIAMCYNVATPKIWSEIFKINTIDDLKNELIEIFEKSYQRENEIYGNRGWGTDQTILYDKVMTWNNKTNNFVAIDEKTTKFKRLDRNTFNLNDKLEKLIHDGFYSDYHCYRPMSKYKEINWSIYNLL